MNKIFAKTFLALQAKPTKRICKNWDLSLFLLYDVKLHGKKEKTGDSETCIPGKWEKEWNQINRTLLLRWVLNLFFITERISIFSYSMVGFFWKTLGEIISITRPDTSFFWLVWWALMIYCFYWKTSAWSKDNKDVNPSSHNCCLIFILRCSGRKFLVWL